MSTSPTEEYLALLTLMRDVTTSEAEEALLKLVTNWEKKVPENEKKEIFSRIPKSQWLGFGPSSAFSIWAWEQKQKYPKEIKASADQIWPLDEEIFYADLTKVFKRLALEITQARTTDRIDKIVSIIGYDPYEEVLEDTEGRKAFTTFLDALGAHSPKHLASFLLQLDEQQLKKLKTPWVKQLQILEQNAILINPPHTNAKNFVTHKLPKLRAIQAENLSPELIEHLCKATEDMSYADFAVIQHTLLAAGWTPTMVHTLARKIDTEDIDQTLDKEWMAHYWSVHNKSDLLLLYTYLALKFVQFPAESQQLFTQISSFLENLKTHNVVFTAQEVNRLLDNPQLEIHSILDSAFYELSSEPLKRLQKTYAFLTNPEFFENLQQVLPSKIMGTLLFLAREAGVSAPVPLSVLKISKKSVLTQEEITDHYGYNGIDQKYLKIQSHYLAFLQKCTITKSIGATPKSTVSRRKM